VGYVLNGQNYNLSTEPFEKDGKNFVPLKEVVQGLGGTADWDNNAKTATVTIGQWTANVQMGSSTIPVSSNDGRSQNVNLSAEPFVENDTMYVPWDFFRDVYGYQTSMQGGEFRAGLQAA
jgi:hypothetical protein